MRIIEGTPAELIEYRRSLGKVNGESAVGDDDLPAENNEGSVARTANALEDGDDAFFIKQFVYGRATTPTTTRRIFAFLDGALASGTILQVGESQGTSDGLSNYLMVREAAHPYRFGAVAYLKPSNGGLTLRLRPDDVSDVIDDPHVLERQVNARQPYAINCPLKDDEAVDLALTLLDRALEKVRAAT